MAEKKIKKDRQQFYYVQSFKKKIIREFVAEKTIQQKPESRI